MGRGVHLCHLLGIGTLGLALAGPSLAQGSSSPADNLSAGCGLEAPSEPPSAVQVDGTTRALIAAVPEDYDPDRPHQLVLAFHGRTSPNDLVRRYYDLERHATRPTIFVYPSGAAEDDGTFSWSDPGDPAHDLRDYALFDALVETFAASYCIDRGRIFAVGHSLGAWFVNSLGCARGDVLRAVGTLAGGISGSECRGPTAAAFMHNPNDRMVPFEHGLAALELYLAENQADVTMTDGVDGPRALVQEAGFVCRHYDGDGGDHPVLWCPHNRDHTRRGRYYPHHWPAGTGALIMSFFDSLPDPDGPPVEARAQVRPGAG